MQILSFASKIHSRQSRCSEEFYKLFVPDFYLPDYNTYIEVKGYKRERDDAKWSAFTGTLTIVDTSIIHKLERFSSIEEFIEQRVFSII